MGQNLNSLFLGSIKCMEIPLNGYEDYFIQWIPKRECLHVSTKRFCCEGPIIESTQTHQKQASQALHEKLT